MELVLVADSGDGRPAGRPRCENTWYRLRTGSPDLAAASGRV